MVQQEGLEMISPSTTVFWPWPHQGAEDLAKLTNDLITICGWVIFSFNLKTIPKQFVNVGKECRNYRNDFSVSFPTSHPILSSTGLLTCVTVSSLEGSSMPLFLCICVHIYVYVYVFIYVSVFIYVYVFLFLDRQLILYFFLHNGVYYTYDSAAPFLSFFVEE